jgi:hypothetical protein
VQTHFGKTNKQTINSATKLQRKYRNFRVFVQTRFGFKFIKKINLKKKLLRNQQNLQRKEK